MSYKLPSIICFNKFIFAMHKDYDFSFDEIISFKGIFYNNPNTKDGNGNVYKPVDIVGGFFQQISNIQIHVKTFLLFLVQINNKRKLQELQGKTCTSALFLNGRY